MSKIIINFFDPEESGIVEYGFIDSPFGRCVLGFNRHGVCVFEFPDRSEAETVTYLREAWPDSWIEHNHSLDKMSFEKFLLDTESPFPRSLCLRGTPFQVEVWKALLDIPMGETATYTDIANMIGRPEAVRAVATAIASNTLGMVIPCHRVIRSDGDTGEYRWGTERKRAILEWERSIAKKD